MFRSSVYSELIPLVRSMYPIAADRMDHRLSVGVDLFRRYEM